MAHITLHHTSRIIKTQVNFTFTLHFCTHIALHQNFKKNDIVNLSIVFKCDVPSGQEHSNDNCTLLVHHVQ